MTLEEHQTHLTTAIEKATELSLVIRLTSPGDLVVISCTPEQKPDLAQVVTFATQSQLRVKWCNKEGTLVAIGVPTQKPVKKELK